MSSRFIISLDFELHWGGSEKWALEPMKPYFERTREAIPAMLALFEKYQTHVTWATVGLLFHESREEMLAGLPATRPTYDLPIAAYDYITNQGVGENEAQDPYHFAPSLIRQILQTPYQELATHSYSHYYCNEAGQTPEQFRADLQAAQKVAREKFDVSLKSLVFPRNQFNEEYLKICREEGITSVRSNPEDWFWHIDSTQSESKWKRLVRGADAFLPIGKRSSFSTRTINSTLPVLIPASRLLRPYSAREANLNDWKLRRIFNEMKEAARSGETYHLWWHPHNFSHETEQNLSDLKEILEYYREMHRTYGMESVTMAEFTEMITHEKA
jgi:peptidoglycan/xylan/chitin deacetylase (PgdA/CDA1 family)